MCCNTLKMCTPIFQFRPIAISKPIDSGLHKQLPRLDEQGRSSNSRTSFLSIGCMRSSTKYICYKRPSWWYLCYLPHGSQQKKASKARIMPGKTLRAENIHSLVTFLFYCKISFVASHAQMEGWGECHDTPPN